MHFGRDKGADKDTYLSNLYSYFIEGGKKAGSSYNETSTMTLVRNNAQAKIEGDNFIVGPYTIKASNIDSDIMDWATSVTDGAGNQLTNHQILINQNGTKVATSKTLKELLNQEFYISVPKDTTNAIQLDITGTHFDTVIEYWSEQNPSQDRTQPVVKAKPLTRTINLSDKKTKPEEDAPIFDLALRKYIVSIDGVAPTTSRVPQVNTAKLKNGETTADKPHTKTPLKVRQGSKVIYNITIYNEGNVDGYATEITDYLPEGLKLAKDSQINRDNGWTNPSGDEKTIVSTNLSGKLLKAFDGGNTLSSQTLQVECEVTANAKRTPQTLKNVAEITDQIDINGNKHDEDSTPENLTPEQKNTYKPTDPSPGWGYEDDDDYEDLILPANLFDLALRKYIVSIDGVAPTTSRVPQVNTAKLKNGETTADKPHTKTPLPVRTGSKVVYNITIYNEGNVDGYATEITDYLPEGLKLAENSQINRDNGWTNPSGDGKTIVSTNLTGKLLKAFDGGSTLSSQTLQVECEVIAKDKTTPQTLRNVAEITKQKDIYGNEGTDIDSVPDNLSDKLIKEYNPGHSEEGWGYEDDDDYEDLILPAKTVDLALRKFITEIGDREITDRIPQVDVSPLLNGKTTATYTHPKTPIDVEIGDIVTYTIRIYNEGEISVYAGEVTDHLPPELEFLPNDEINKANGWQLVNDGSGRTIKTSALAKNGKLDNKTTQRPNGALLSPFNGTNLDYIDLKVRCKVKQMEEASIGKKITNIAEVTEYEDEDGEEFPEDRDSESDGFELPPDDDLPEYDEHDEDDDDFEKIIVKPIDLSLRKFITAVGENEITNRIPQPDVSPIVNGKDTTANYNHTKKPLEVDVGDIVTYTIRVYNEGKRDVYAAEVTDHLPQELEFLPNDEINKANGWTLVEGSTRTVVTKALEKGGKLDNKTTNRPDGALLKAFNGTSLDYMDLKIRCRVKKEALEDPSRKITNIAEITIYQLKNGEEIKKDVDSESKNFELVPDSELPEFKDKLIESGATYIPGDEDDDDFEKVIVKPIDLSLRKFITAIGERDITNRVPDVNVSPLTDASEDTTTAIYNHTKEPLGVKVGDIVTYTIRVYNEGKQDVYAKEVTDHLPPELEFLVDDELNKENGWKLVTDENGVSDGRAVYTTALAKDGIFDVPTEERPNGALLKAFDGTKLDYMDLKIRCKVRAYITKGEGSNKENIPVEQGKYLTNIADITKYQTKDGEEFPKDIDSESNNFDVKDEELPGYKNHEIENGDKYIPGKEDDDDFEKIVIESFDLALRKFITKVNDKAPEVDRTPVFTTNLDKNGNYIYEHTKEPVLVKTTDIVTYTIRIFNEGSRKGFAREVKDDIPEGLEFLPTHDTNTEYRWIMLDKDGNETEDPSKAKHITTDYLSKEQGEARMEEGETENPNLLLPFTKGMESPDYRDVKVAFKVIAPNTSDKIIINTAQISDDEDEEGNDVPDKDSEPDNDNPDEDDQDIDKIKLQYFDLALRKFITKVNEQEVNTRIPAFKIDENGKYTYEHTKEPVLVQNGNIVTYTIRVYNEGTLAGYAKEIKDDLPLDQGLEFLPEHDTNKEYRWVMLDKDGNETENVQEATDVKTDYLSKEQETEEGENLLKAFDKDAYERGEITEPDNREVKIAFKVIEPNTSDRILVNRAQISDDSDEEGNDVTDIDSTPNKWNEGEDDQDIEKVRVQYFDLALRKWVTQAIVIENGKQTVINSGHKPEDDPEDVLKVDLDKKNLNNVVVKFKYSIRITNEGEIEGYAKEISDYIPQGLKFVASDNPMWKETEGKVVTEALADTLLKPGEYADVEILLTWENSGDNLGVKTNIAEISKDYNESNTPDIDSTPNNKKPKEDDIDDAPVALSIILGSLPTYIGIVFVVVSIIGLGVFLIRKYVI